MATWLLKTEPSAYAFDDLLRERATAWTGVRNPQARLHLGAMKAGDEVAVYHTGGEKAAVGLATVRRAAYPDPAGGPGGPRRIEGERPPNASKEGRRSI